MKLTHFSASPLLALDQRQYRQESALKPAGLWVSVEGDGDGWSDWCRSEEFGLDQLAYEHEVALAPEANLLRIHDSEGIDAFTSRHVKPDRYIDYIDWPGVAEQYQGILVTPYIWSRRFARHTFWYYGWDCASGCIWDIAAVQSLRLASQAGAR